ncbi:hypothetical protein SAMN04487943_102273 [Gracilibacillus orientalis]|uniref:DUF5105 domain-containing protein n=1 Tax=Gracilibacillus orientalis TaxID=334253 RepID=A0A1I4ISB6_9BACI|nr:hypothetical protein [Gracilibacillus orientalis]SFL57262.1 hypothetical protein SAMN04487943_102273 [Gracilibacillus orientalis]
MKKKLLFIILLLLLSLVLMACTQNDTDESETEDPENEVEEPAESEESSEEEIPTFNEEQAKEVLQDYRDTFMSVIENTEDDGALTDYDSKEALKEEFMTIMSEELADSYVAQYFEEDNGRVNVVPTEAPVWFDEEKDFSFEQVNDSEYEVTQEQSNELIGNVRMIYVITLADDSWIVSEVRSENLNEENNQNGQEDDQASSDENNSDNNQETDTAEITAATAEDLVKEELNISENSDIHVVMDHQNDDGNFVVQVYELVSNGETSHTATIGWYIVDQADGTVEEM